MSERYLEDPDVQLMLRVRRGDSAAFDELTRVYSAVLVNFCLKFVGSVSVAEDLAQDVLLKVFKAAPGYEPSAKFRTWLLTIATNVCLNRRRWQKKHGHLSLDAPVHPGVEQTFAETIPGDGVMPDHGLEQDEVVRKVRAALLALPETQRAAMILARYHEFSYADIAETMNLSVMAVKSLLNRAKENLREQLARELDEFKTRQPENQGAQG